jgi:predicted AlkP superfamily pyrophosphatase or phosphodiesterase
MRRLLASLLLLAAAIALQPDIGARQPSPARAPRLAVLLVVDQMRADYLEIPRASWRGGFRRLLADGAVFEHGEYPYMNTVTCAGHSTIGTGAFPHTHGMTLNAWYDRSRRASVSCTDDPDSPLVSYGREGRLGTSGKLLRAPTLADELRSQHPDSRVVTMSLKARSAIGLAGHGGTAVSWIDDAAGSFVTSKAFAAAPVPAVADFLERNPIDADRMKTWTLRDAPSTYRYPDSSVGSRPPAGRTNLFPQKVGAANGADPQFFSLWQASPYSNAYLARMAAAMVDAFSLGQHEGTDFLGVSLSALDMVGHAYGPESREIEDMLRRLDDTIGTLMDDLDAKVGRGNWVLGFSADHGVAPVPASSGGGRIVTDDVRDRIEETLTNRWGARTDGTGYVASVTFNYVYLSPGVFDRLKQDAAASAELEKAIIAVPGMTRVLRADRLSATSPDREIKAAALSYVPDRSGDLVLVGKPFWMFGGRGDSSATTHGTANPYDRQVPVVLLGAGIKPGRYAQSASPADLAPTLAQIIGVKMPKAEGRVLREGLR